MEDPQVKRLQQILKDSGESQRGLAKIFDISHSHLRRMLNGEWDINFRVIHTICVKLGYSPSWFLLGIGDKKIKGNEAKLITEIQTLRVELDIITNLNLKLQARITGIEREYEDLKKQIAEIRNSKTV